MSIEQDKIEHLAQILDYDTTQYNRVRYELCKLKSGYQRELQPLEAKFTESGVALAVIRRIHELKILIKKVDEALGTPKKTVTSEGVGRVLGKDHEGVYATHVQPVDDLDWSPVKRPSSFLDDEVPPVVQLLREKNKLVVRIAEIEGELKRRDES